MRGLSWPFGRRSGLCLYPLWSSAYCGWREPVHASLLRPCVHALWGRSLPYLYCTRLRLRATVLSTALPDGDCGKLIDEVEHIERQVVTYHVADIEFQYERKKN